ncbi:MAG: hypothetical protein ACLVCH_13110 [Roseburia inulinivorans]
MKKQVYRKLLAACVSVSLGTVLLAGCGRFCRNDWGQDRRRFFNSRSTRMKRTLDVSEAQQESKHRQKYRENLMLSEDVVEPVGRSYCIHLLPDGPEESDIFVQPVCGFFRMTLSGGMDASAVLSE